MDQLPYARAPEIEGVAPLAPGVYRNSGKRTIGMVLLSLLMTLASLWVMLVGLSAEWDGVRGTVAVIAGGFGVLFFGFSSVAWGLQALVVTESGFRSRIPMPGSARVSFSDVKAIVVFPIVHTRAGNMPTAVLLNQEGRSLFRFSTPPYPDELFEGLVALTHRYASAPVWACRTEVQDIQFMRRMHLPDLIPGGPQ